MHNYHLIFLLVALIGGFGLITPMKIEELNGLNAENFVSKLGKIFENSAWVVQEAYGERPFETVDQLFNAMECVLMNAGREKQLKLIRAHPDLAGNEMFSGNLTQHSTSEQANAGLSALTAQQLAEFNSLNSAYKSRFNFPFIIALRDQKEEQEINEALSQIGRIARHRLDTLMMESK
ncbi:hypothetical protein niasHT_034165 [Heterodera trifolii]|uniref:2-oxo-4-hydroxy-4-carboxy-5-ureidoimidazoline decarboxylase n=1 Tax=Heterodera trifolii TaxID=157864 RepID=A0ABD2IA00_9BILA